MWGKFGGDFFVLHMLLELGFAGLLGSPVCVLAVCAPGFESAQHHYGPEGLVFGGSLSRKPVPGPCRAGGFLPVLGEPAICEEEKVRGL